MHYHRKRGKNRIWLATIAAAIFITAAALLMSGGESGDHTPPAYAPETPRVATEPPGHTNIPPEGETPSVAPKEPQETAYKTEGEETRAPVVEVYTEAGRFYPTERDLDILAQMIWGEARGTSTDEQRLVVWTVLQRIDDPRWPDCIEGVITQPWQFVGWQAHHPIYEEMRQLAYAEVMAWAYGAAPLTIYPFAPTAPYFFFEGDYRPGSREPHHNWFREVWRP